MNDFFDARVRTTDASDTQAWLQTHYGRVDLLADRAAIAEHAVGDAGFALRRLTWACRAEIAYEADRFFFATSGPGLAWRIGACAGDYSVEPGLVQPGQEFSGRPDQTEVDLLTFDPAWLTEAAQTIYGDDELEVRFDGTGPVSRRMRDYWLATMRWALTQTPLLAEPLVRAQVRRSLAAATLEAFPLAGDPRERRASAIEQASVYTSAASWIDDHASLPVTIDDAARAVGTSTKGLRRAFLANGHLASTPEDYLSQARLSAAHADLIAADPSGTSVGAIAARWGFSDAAEFERAYREMHRVAPAETLNR